MTDWEREPFARSPAELDLHEALLAVERVLERSDLKLMPGARQALEQAVWALQSSPKPPIVRPIARVRIQP